jgi:TIR domain/Pentapeptide repeats (8 copies)
MANPDHLAILKQGVEVWNKWRQDNPRIYMPDLAGADLSNAHLIGINLSKANLFKAKLREAKVSFADLSSAYLVAADLTKVECIGTYFTGADLTRAKLRKAGLIGSAFGIVQNGNQTYGVSLFRTGPNLSGTDFTQAQMAHCVFANTDLSKSKGLETVVHTTPSSVDVATIYLSKGRIPDDFLRGCGMPESFLKFQRTLRSHRTDFHSCFISYSTKDEDFADRLRADLQSSGVRCWFAPHQIRGGKKLYDQIHAAISDHDRLLLILSEHSLNSEWVKTEIANARQREVTEKRRNALSDQPCAIREDQTLGGV